MITDDSKRIMECMDHLVDINRILKENTKLELRIKIVKAKINSAIEILKEEEDYERIHPISAHKIT
tara:strand:+ start:2096 stop:2293 length:198 start_codon:yes stop_codon:yes gene_type:complete